MPRYARNDQKIANLSYNLDRRRFLRLPAPEVADNGGQATPQRTDPIAGQECPAYPRLGIITFDSGVTLADRGRFPTPLMGDYVRPTHISVKNYPYFVTTRLNNNLEIFTDEKNAQILLAALYFGREKGWYLLISVAIMPDHLHLILVPKEKDISPIMKSIKGYTSRELNENLNRRGTLWQENFYDYILDKEEKLITKARYVEENPVRKGLVSKVEDYRFSSAHVDNPNDLDLYFGGINKRGTRNSRLRDKNVPPIPGKQ